MATALSRRPALRFFVAFYRWTLHTHHPHAAACQRNRHGSPTTSNSHVRRFHESRRFRRETTLEEALSQETRDRETLDEAEVISKNQLSGRRRNPSEKGESLDRSYPGDSHSEDVLPTQDSVSNEALPTLSETEKQDTSDELVEPEHMEAALKDSVRMLLRKVPNSVAVVTVRHFDEDMKKLVPMGVAVSSLTSVTLDPPTISFNIKEPSKTLEAIRAARGLFRVHFPAANMGGADIVESFCGGNHPKAYNQRSKDLSIYVPLERPPQIHDHSIHATMECKLTHELSVADHIILAAKVERIELKPMTYPLMVYVDGNYVRAQGTVGTHGKKKVSLPDSASFSIWDYSFFPGPSEEARRGYVNSIKSFIVEKSLYRTRFLSDEIPQLHRSLPYAASFLGINLGSILFALNQKLDPDHPNYERLFKSEPAMCAFYGRLTPSTRATIIDKAIEMVRKDPASLNLGYEAFLYSLSVYPGSKNFLPSDIMNALRSEGLAKEFELKKWSEVKQCDDIQALEQVEYRLRNYLSKLTFPEANKVPLESIMASKGEPSPAAMLLKRSRPRLVVEAHPSHYDESRIDIRGELTEIEARVVLARIVSYLQFRNQVKFARNIARHPNSILYFVRVHPEISGMDIEYLFAKIIHMYKTTHLFATFTLAMADMLKPWFRDQITKQELAVRVRDFVETAPLRAVQWGRRDVLSALGLSWKVRISRARTAPSHSESFELLNSTSSKTLFRLLQQVLRARQERKRQQGEESAEEDAAIARFLEKKDFDPEGTSSEQPSHGRRV